MATLSMQAIAQLAQVKRPVVSMWRTRFASAERPFPSPVANQPLLFDATEVGTWLSETGRGNNPDSRLEALMHSSDAELLATDLDHSSALLLLHELRGEAVTQTPLADAIMELQAHELDRVADVDLVADALTDKELCGAVDRLAEAAFSGARVLDRLIDTFTRPNGEWAAEALTRDGEQLLGAIATELYRAQRPRIIPAGPGGLMLTRLVVAQLSETERPVVIGPANDETVTATTRVAWRGLAAHGCPLEGSDAAGSTASLRLIMEQQPTSGEELMDRITDAVLELGPTDALLVVAPARHLVDEAGQRVRQELLAPSDGYTAPLRYVARLPQGLSRFGGRRRLALWGFAPSAPDQRTDWTTVGNHSGTKLDVVSRQAIAADVAAAMLQQRDVHAHATLSSHVRESSLTLRQRSLTVDSAATVTADGGNRLARVWELDRTDLLSGIALTASDAQPRTVSFARAIRGLGRDLAGVRIADDHLGEPADGSVTVIGARELRNHVTIGRRTINRLELERVAPQARFTEPDDVVYVAAGGPAAWLDRDGGHLVQAPARIFRCLDAARGDPRRLLPTVVAADIARQTGNDRRSWTLRTVPADRVAALTEITGRTSERRRLLLDELTTLDALEREAVDGLAAGSLAAELTDTNRP